MIKMYSQRDPAYGKLKLGSTTVYKDGCTVCSLATLFQVDPTVILAIPKAFNSRGEADVKRIVEFLGGKIAYRGKKKPIGWCMARTKHYAKQGVPSHYFSFCENVAIDPLMFPCDRILNPYKVEEYIVFTGVKLDFSYEDLERRLRIAEAALDRVSGLRKSSLLRFLERGKQILLNLFSSNV